MKTPLAAALLALVALAFAAGYWAGHRQGTTLAAVHERFDAIDTKLAELEKARPAARPAEPKPIDPKQATRLIALDGAPVRGAPGAPVTIVEYGDFQCPFCLRAHPTLERVLAEYAGKVRVVFKHFPLSFHRDAMNAHKAAAAAGEQGKFWEMHDLIFTKPNDLEPETMRQHAAQLGLDLARFDSDYASKKIEAKIAKDQAEGRKVAVRGTPAFFINGKYLAGAQPFEAFKAQIEEALGAGA
jgi:protein-disulfide isomerase